MRAKSLMFYSLFMMTQSKQNPLQHICVLLEHPGHGLPISQLITQGGFSVSLFVSTEKVAHFLADKPLTAAVLNQQNSAQDLEGIRKVYKGPVFPIPVNKEDFTVEVPELIAELHRRQLQIDHPSTLATLRALIRFITGQVSFLCLVGKAENLDLALGIINLRTGQEGRSLPTGHKIEAQGPSTWYLSRNLFKKTHHQQADWVRSFRHHRAFRHLVLEEITLDGLDDLEGDPNIDEHLFELLAAHPVDVDTLGDFTLEELCVQPMDPPTVTRHFDEELFDDNSHAKNKKETNQPLAKAPGFLNRWLGKFK